MSAADSLQAAIAAHRFGLGEASLATVGNDPMRWLSAQIGPADAARGEGLLSTSQALAHVAAERAERRELKAKPPVDMNAASDAAVAQALGKHYRELIVADARSRLLTAATTQRPFTERLQWFWANHFTVSLAKGTTRGLVGAFERDAIRPNIAGSFGQLLLASTTHPAMLRYLDNVQSAGPNSTVVARLAKRSDRTDEKAPRVTGLNENLAREVFELHTLGADSARGANPVYTQADVTEFARVLTGWRVGYQESDDSQRFNAAWHEPGPKTVIGRRYAEGPQALRGVLHDLAHHPATARFIATKLARHFVADDPPAALVDRLADVYQRSETQLAPVYRALIASPEAWRPQAAKLKTPEEFIVSSMRMLSIDPRVIERGNAQSAAAIGTLGQRLQYAPSPAGWSDRADDWLGPDAVWKRIEWATRTADRLGGNLDARSIAVQSLGPLLGNETRAQLDRAADGSQALALLLMSPEFQRR